jgi:Cof subfamily protein (haloacid dehalogenase superfamily)
MDAIREVQAAGVRFGVSTGRDVMELANLFNGDDVAFRSGILSNGKKILVDGEVVRLSLIDNAALDRLAAEISTYPGTMVTAYPLKTDETNPIYCMGATQEELEEWARTYAFTGTRVDRFPDVEVLGATIACAGEEEVLERIEEFVLTQCPEFDLGKPSARWWDILPKGLNKGTALQMLLDELGIARDEVVVFGDADNDLSMLQAVPNSVAVANASEAAAAAARWHIGDAQEQSVARAMAEIAEATARGELPAFMR